MQLTQFLLLACSSLALANPAPYRHGRGGEWHRSYKSGCASPTGTAAPVRSSPGQGGSGGGKLGGGGSGSGGSGSGGYGGIGSSPIYLNSTWAAPPYSVGPTATGMSTSAGGLPTETSPPIDTSLPSESASTAAPSSSSSAASSSAASSPAEAPTSTAAAAPVASSTTAAAQVASISAASVSGGTTYTATFTQYGAGDTFGSGNCNTATAACGWYSNPGYNAAASQNLFGVGPGAGAGPGCGLCFRVTAKTNPYDNNAALTGTQSIVLKVNNLCPADGNPLCSQSSLTATNSLGGNVNFDLCKDDGAAAALFGSSGAGAALGTAEQVSCSEWSGSGNLTS